MRKVTKEGLTKLKRLIGRATEGPWLAEPKAGRGAWIKGSATGEWVALACGDTNLSASYNADLILSAKNDMPALIALVEKLSDATKELSRVLFSIEAGNWPKDKPFDVLTTHALAIDTALNITKPNGETK